MTLINEVTIIAKDHGLVALLGSFVVNSGFIKANVGSIALGAGNQFTLDFHGDWFAGKSIFSDGSAFFDCFHYLRSELRQLMLKLKC